MTKNYTKDYSTQETEEGRVYQAIDLNFRPDKKCNHKFIRKSSTKVECEKCHVGFFDNGDFPLNELNKYYGKNIDIE